MKLSRREMIAASVASLLVPGCGGGGSSKPRIGLAFETLQTEYWDASYRIFLDELDKRGFDVLEAVADGDASKQLDQVKSFITRGVDGIIVAPKDANTAIPLVKNANRAGIPIVFYNRPPAENAGEYTAVQADNFSISKATASYMAEEARRRGGKYQAMILVGDLNDMNAIGRREGFEAAVKEHEDIIELAAEVPTEWNQEKAREGVDAVLLTNPAINFIFTSSDFLFPSLVRALEAAGKYKKIGEEGHVILGGFDGDATAYRMLVDGYLDADGVQDVYFECEQSVQAILDRRAGKDVPKLIRDEGFVIHQGNLEEAKSRMWGANV
jgi:ABC-type sugar transport system substrate-binding protein